MLLKLENLNHYQSSLLLATFSGNVNQLLREWQCDPDSLLAECSFIAQGLLATPPTIIKNQTHGFIPSVESIGMEEDVKQLEWIEVPNQQILLAQGSAFQQFILWYLEQYLGGKLVLPPKAQWSHQREKWIITDGTHRYLAAQNLADQEKNNAHLMTNSTTVLAKSKKNLATDYVYHVDQIIVTQ